MIKKFGINWLINCENIIGFDFILKLFGIGSPEFTRSLIFKIWDQGSVIQPCLIFQWRPFFDETGFFGDHFFRSNWFFAFADDTSFDILVDGPIEVYVVTIIKEISHVHESCWAIWWGDLAFLWV